MPLPRDDKVRPPDSPTQGLGDDAAQQSEEMDRSSRIRATPVVSESPESQAYREDIFLEERIWRGQRQRAMRKKGYPSIPADVEVKRIASKQALRLVIKNHYLHRRCGISYAFGLVQNGKVRGVLTFGVPALTIRVSACPCDPDSVMELNRLWISDTMPYGIASWFISKAFSELPPLIIVSYADTQAIHTGGMYRASSFNYAGWSDMECVTPKTSAIVGNAHSKSSWEAIASGRAVGVRLRRLPKIRYWTVTGSRREKRFLRGVINWPSLDWKLLPPPTSHKRASKEEVELALK